jgi:hypothetical protein
MPVRLRVRRPDGASSDLPSSRKWRNWQTHQLEGLAVAIPWGFESPLSHHPLASLVSGCSRAASGFSAVSAAMPRLGSRAASPSQTVALRSTGHTSHSLRAFRVAHGRPRASPPSARPCRALAVERRVPSDGRAPLDRAHQPLASPVSGCSRAASDFAAVSAAMPRFGSRARAGTRRSPDSWNSEDVDSSCSRGWAADANNFML